jgi:hypothetical protein
MSRRQGWTFPQWRARRPCIVQTIALGIVYLASTDASFFLVLCKSRLGATGCCRFGVCLATADYNRELDCTASEMRQKTDFRSIAGW